MIDEHSTSYTSIGATTHEGPIIAGISSDDFQRLNNSVRILTQALHDNEGNGEFADPYELPPEILAWILNTCVTMLYAGCTLPKSIEYQGHVVLTDSLRDMLAKRPVHE